MTDAQSTAPSGTVDHMTPAPGNYPSNQQITLYVSGGGQPVPNVVNQTAAEAQAILRQDGFKVHDRTARRPPRARWSQPGTVYNQNPAANQVEPKGTLIQIFVEPQNCHGHARRTRPRRRTPATPTSTDTGTATPTPTTGNGGGTGNGNGLGGL